MLGCRSLPLFITEPIDRFLLYNGLLFRKMAHIFLLSLKLFKNPTISIDQKLRIRCFDQFESPLWFEENKNLLNCEVSCSA
jgi:hypothetical protein